MPTKKLESDYEVSRTTVFEWPSTERAAEAEPHLERSAKLIERRLQHLCPDRSAVVSVVRVEDAPQLRVVLKMPRSFGELIARKRFDYSLERAMTVKVPMGPRRRTQLSPPWGATVVGDGQH